MGRCEVCGQNGGYSIEHKDWEIVKKVLFFFNRVRHDKEFCKEHCFETYERLFLKNETQTVVFQPSINNKYGSYYMFANLEIVKREFMINNLSRADSAKIYPKVYEVLKNRLNSASSTCQDCSGDSNIVYYPTIWDEFVKNMDMKPEYLCPKCAFRKIKKTLFEIPNKHFIAPHKTDYGICVGVLD